MSFSLLNFGRNLPAFFWVFSAIITGDCALIPAPHAGPATTVSPDPFQLERIPNEDSIRYQQVYGASAFSSLGADGGIINYITFRTPFGTRPFGADLPSVEILMSTTTSGPDALSTTFSANHGANTQTVYAKGPLFLFGSGGGLNARIDLQTPFYYNPADGNLLLEVRNFMLVMPPWDTGRIVPALDAVEVMGDTVSRLVAYDVTATTGFTDSLGLMTWFAVTPVPEPAPLALGLAGAGITALVRWRKTRKDPRP